MTTAILKGDFKETGIYHFKLNAISEEAFALNSVSENPSHIKNSAKNEKKEISGTTYE